MAESDKSARELLEARIRGAATEELQPATVERIAHLLEDVEHERAASLSRPFVRAGVMLGVLEGLAQSWNRPTAWDLVGPLLQNELCGRLAEARQLFHALAELEALAHDHAPTCEWQPARESGR